MTRFTMIQTIYNKGGEPVEYVPKMGTLAEFQWKINI